MKIVNFGEIMRKLRSLRGITQGELVDLIDVATNGESGIDAVSISRWENNVIVPCHRKQVELIRSLGFDLSELVTTDCLLVTQDVLRSYLLEKMIIGNYWDFSSLDCELNDLEVTVVNSNGIHSYLIAEKYSQIPVAHVKYHYSNDELSRGERYIVLDALYCTNVSLLLEIVCLTMSKVVSEKNHAIIYRSKHKNTPITRFVKSLGFKVIDKKSDEYLSVLTYSDIIYNQNYFYASSCYKVRLEELANVP